MSPACQGSAGAARFAATPLTGRDMAKMGRVFRAAGRLGVPESAAAAHSMSAVTKYRETRHVPTKQVFNGQKTKTIYCEEGLARVNPEYKLFSLIGMRRVEGIPVEA